MLRNTIRLCDALHVANPLLNEVLSLNAQESGAAPRSCTRGSVLNEVLSLNAQESRRSTATGIRAAFLNEVLSLNAQELFRSCAGLFFFRRPQ